MDMLFFYIIWIYIGMCLKVKDLYIFWIYYDGLLICILEKVVVMKNFKFFIIFLIYFVRCILILIKICIFIVNIMENKLIK